MSIVAISENRTVPVQEDLTREDLQLSILRGLEKMHRVDKKVAAGVSLVKGEWAVLKDDDTVERAGADAVANCYLVFAGTDRFDAKATGQVTIIMASQIVVKTTMYDATADYHVGDLLSVKAVTGSSYVTKAGVDEPARAKVVALGDGYLVYEIL
jgi:hypothetical protein